MTEELCLRLLRSPAYSHAFAQTSIFHNRPYWAVYHHDNASLSGTRCVGWVSDTIFRRVTGTAAASTAPAPVIHQAPATEPCAVERN